MREEKLEFVEESIQELSDRIFESIRTMALATKEDLKKNKLESSEDVLERIRGLCLFYERKLQEME